MKYNGWSNYETWVVSLWLSNDEGSQSETELCAQDTYDLAEASTYFTRAEVATQNLAEHIKQHVENGNPLADEASLYSDLMNSALSEVNWYEITESYITELSD